MKQYRYIIKGFPCDWHNCSDVSIAKMNFVAERFNKWYGNDWNIEYRG